MASLVVGVVENNLRAFAKLLQETYHVEVAENLWRTIQTSSGGCPVLLKSGARAGQPCGGKVPAGKSACSRHSGKTPSQKESKTPKPTVANAQWRMKANKHGLFVTPMAPFYVIDRNTSVFYGKLSEFESETVLPLSGVDKELLRARNHKVADSPHEPNHGDHDKEEEEEEVQDDSETVEI
jgi:hypothetical protein